MATGCYLPRMTVCFRPNMKKTICWDMQVDRDFATVLAYLGLRSFHPKVRSNVPTTILLWSGALSHTILSGLPLRIFFCKGSCRHYQTLNREWQIFLKRVERIYRSLICLIACQHAWKAKNIPWASRKAWNKRENNSKRMAQIDENIKKQLDKP